MHLRPSSTTAVLGVVSPLVLIVLGTIGVAGGGFATPGGVILVLGLVLAVAVAWELPWRTDIDEQGIARRSVLRTQRVGWDDLVAFERGGRRRGGALVARTVDGRHLALSDAPERPDQWDALRLLVSDHAQGVVVPPPPEGHPFAGRDPAG